MSGMRHKGYAARVEFDAEDRLFVGHIAGIRDVIGFHGETVAELEAAFREAVDDYLAMCAKLGKAPEKKFTGNVMFRIAPEVHRAAVRAAALAGKSLNTWGEEALARAAEEAA